MRHAALASLILLSACGSPPAEDADRAEAPAAAPVETDMAQTDRAPAGQPGAASQPTAENAAGPGSCAADIGEAAAQDLVDRCIAVSPATNPPCNVQNSCEMIQGEIDRACTLFADDPPAECVAG